MSDQNLTIKMSIDVEYEIKQALDPYFTTYLKPIPKGASTTHLEVVKTGGSIRDSIDTSTVQLYSVAPDEATADNNLRTAIGALTAIADSGATEIRNVTVNSTGSWGKDPAHPDLALCSALLEVTSHLTSSTIN